MRKKIAHKLLSTNHALPFRLSINFAQFYRQIARTGFVVFSKQVSHIKQKLTVNNNQMKACVTWEGWLKIALVQGKTSLALFADKKQLFERPCLFAACIINLALFCWENFYFMRSNFYHTSAGQVCFSLSAFSSSNFDEVPAYQMKKD